ncbi:MAG: hypothetical protein E7273_00100 [Pseudobutyrivibrio ruminis]|nr:hypothetical protein [Pseudobutyrivibrio ruminis]
MTILRACVFILHFTLVPIMIGRLITYRARTGWIADYLVGFFGNLAIFYILYSIVEWIQNWCTFVDPVIGGFTLLLKVYGFVLAVLLILWICLERKSLSKAITKLRIKLINGKLDLIADRFNMIYLLIFIIILVFQMYMAFAYEINQWSYDDYDYVVTSQDTITSDTLSYVNFIDGTMPNVAEKRAVASWGTYVSMLAKTTGFEVTTVYHTILPVFLLLLAYINFYYIAKFLFRKLEDRLVFLIVLSIAYIFGLYSHYSSTFRLLGAIWQGKAVLSVIAVPFFMFFLIRAYKEKISNTYLLPIAAISLGVSSLTSLAALFIPILVVLVWLLMCIYHRKIYAVRYLVASLIGPIYLVVFYAFIWMLQHDMQGYDHKYFKFRKTTSWWQRWFH